MAEIRLTCPECSTEYRLPDGTIPPAGREVECTACGKIWWAERPRSIAPAPQPATGPQPDPAPQPVSAPQPGRGSAAAPALPADMDRFSIPISQRLPDDVLRILRDEVEHERSARAAEARRSQPVALPEEASEDWPATTVTGPAEEPQQPPAFQARPAAAPQNPPAPAGPQPITPAPVSAAAPQVSGNDEQDQQDEAPPAFSAPAEPDSPAVTTLTTPPVPAPAPAAQTRRSGYGIGFGLAAMIAALAVSLYLLAPEIADDSSLSENLMQYRAKVDDARSELHMRLSGILEKI